MQFLYFKHDPIAGGVVLDSLNPSIHLCQGQKFNFWFDLMLGRKREHLIDQRPIGRRAAANIFLERNEGVEIDEGAFLRPADEAQGPLGLQQAEDQIPVEICLHGGEDEIELWFLRRVFQSHKSVSAE